MAQEKAALNARRAAAEARARTAKEEEEETIEANVRATQAAGCECRGMWPNGELCGECLWHYVT